MVRDPVCGMAVSERSAHASRHVRGMQVYFCSASCVAAFDAEPQRYYTMLGGAPAAPAPAGTIPAAAQARVPPPAVQGEMLLRPIAFGLLAMLGLLTFYLAIITLAQGWSHALEQLADDGWFFGAIAVGFGTQVALFTHLRAQHNHAGAAGVAASTGTSTAAMLACCAHHLADILPIVGLSGAAIFLNAYKTPLLWLGIVMNLAGVAYLGWKIRQQQYMACHTPIAPRSVA